MGEDGDKTGRTSIIPSFGFPPVLHPNEYVWFVFFSAMDVLLTWAILAAGGGEVNPIAENVIMMWGLNGAIGFKFGLTLFVIGVCEFVGRKRERTGRLLARTAVVVSAFPVVYSLTLLTMHVYATT